ncbi:GDSL-type esterase/lipase family protein [Bogoriella caseilytica]|uniref:Lysophospholipase L1-like esterase n=1 Tax=Bogoriella caseilytica TaxID=56055 RepID=A0A3N2BEU6_9MICO|nr:lysophospholipase L1-like esterase [Bogoriella caseilytica]
MSSANGSPAEHTGRRDGAGSAAAGPRLRICAVGDEFIAGVGDRRALGWTGRVMARTSPEEPILLAELAVPGEATTALAARWQEETKRRFAHDADNRLVIGLGAADLVHGLSVARSRLNLANIVDSATSARLGCFVVGPPPRPDLDADLQASRSRAFADVCERRGITYVETYAPLRAHQDWHSDLSSGDGIHPGQAGYGMLAWLVLRSGWHEWLGVPGEMP